MAIFKCKMCGGDLNIDADVKVVECDYCGTAQTVPSADNEKKMNLFNRANRLRLTSEFDKATIIYENIIAEFPEEAEAYWGLCLCNYGIEYVDDPATAKKVPTCHRASFEKLSEDENFNMAMEYADVVAQKVYRDEAREIERIMEEILSVSKNEKPYDVFICYKETDKKGERTIDSVLAQDIYDALAAKGLKVFFARITLEDKLGQMYEPYIFAALNSAKVLLSVGTKYENFHAVWVKNEWSRFMKLMAKDKTKVLIPCYKDMDAYDLPDEFKALQAQDMSKIGFMQDLVRGVEKVLMPYKQSATVTAGSTLNAISAGAETLLKRAFMFIEDGDWKNADEYCEKVLDIDPENAYAYLGKLMAELQVKKRANLGNLYKTFNDRTNFKKAIRFGDNALADELNGYNKAINNRNQENRLTALYNDAAALMKRATTHQQYKNASERFRHLKDLKFKDSEELYNQCIAKAEKLAEKEKQAELNRKKEEEIQKEKIYKESVVAMSYKKLEKYQQAQESLKSLGDYKDSKLKIAECENEINKIKSAMKKKEKRKKMLLSTMVFSAIILLIVGIVTKPMFCYSDAQNALDQGDFAKAAILFGKAGNYNDAKERAVELWDEIAVKEFVSAGGFHTVILTNDGTAVATEYEGDIYGEDNRDEGQFYVGDWSDLVAVSSGGYHTLGLKSDGTVVGVGSIRDGEADVDWENIVAVYASHAHALGIKADGTVAVIGYDFEGHHSEVKKWRDIVAVTAGRNHTVGLKSDGTVVAAGDNSEGQCNVSDWDDVVAVSANSMFTVGLKSDGTVVATGINTDGQCDVSGWTDVIAISAGWDHTVGLKSDGTVLVAGSNAQGQCNVSEWSDIIAVSSGYYHTVGVKSDGTVVATGRTDEGQCGVKDLTNIKTF